MSRYDRNNELFGVNINGTEYIYLKNMQGDIEGILDMAGSLVVSYAYDAWGRVLSVTGTLADTIGQLNPMRYRGYYLDSETGYYYLQSRYYNPDWCRFINADEPSILPLNYGNTIGANLFAYCENNPVMYSDPSGHWVSRAIVAAASGAIFGGIAYAIGRAIRLKGKPLVALTAGFTAIGLALGLWKGVAILHSINKLIKPVIYFFSNPGKVKFGLKLLGVIQFEIHNPHHNKPIHFVVRVFLKSGQKVWEWWFKK